MEQETEQRLVSGMEKARQLREGKTLNLRNKRRRLFTDFVLQVIFWAGYFILLRSIFHGSLLYWMFTLSAFFVAGVFGIGTRKGEVYGSKEWLEWVRMRMIFCTSLSVAVITSSFTVCIVFLKLVWWGLGITAIVTILVLSILWEQYRYSYKQF